MTSAFTGTIAHYAAGGEIFGDTPFSTGTPLGLVVRSDGTIYFADLGLGFGESFWSR